MSPRRPSEEEREASFFFFFSGFRRGNQTCNKGPRDSWAPVWLKDNICSSLCCVGDVVCWEKPRLQITHRHRPRAKVGGCGVRRAAAALISAGVHRRSFVPAALPDIRRVTLISIRALGGGERETYAKQPVGHMVSPSCPI